MASPVLLALQWQGSFVYVTFDQAITIDPGFEISPFSVTVNAAPNVVTGYTLITNGIALQLTTAPTLGTAAVAVTFNNSGTGNHYKATADATNATNFTAQSALWQLAYPPSVLKQLELSFSGNVVTAAIEVHLSPVDQDLVTQYGPLLVSTTATGLGGGGTCTAVDYSGGSASIADGVIVSAEFTVVGRPDCAAASALDWQEIVLHRIQVALIDQREMDVVVPRGSNAYVTV